MKRKFLTGTVIRKYIFPALCLMIIQTSSAQLHPVEKESSIHFTIRNFGFKTGGKLDPPQGDIVFNPEDLSKSSFIMIVKAETINTDNESRDEHLREEDYFDVKNFPLIHFKSESVKPGKGKGSYIADGTLTIKNKSKPISLPFTAEKSGSGWLFSGSFTMLRRDFGIGGSSTISNELTVFIKVLAQ